MKRTIPDRCKVGKLMVKKNDLDLLTAIIERWGARAGSRKNGAAESGIPKTHFWRLFKITVAHSPCDIAHDLLW